MSNELNVSINVSYVEGDDYEGTTDYGQVLIPVGTTTDGVEHYDDDLIPHLIALGLLPEGYKNEGSA